MRRESRYLNNFLHRQPCQQRGGYKIIEGMQVSGGVNPRLSKKSPYIKLRDQAKIYNPIILGQTWRNLTGRQPKSAHYTFYGAQLVGRYYISGQVSTDSSFPLWIVYLIMPVSGLMFIFRLLTKLYLHFKNGGADWHRANSGEV